MTDSDRNRSVVPRADTAEAASSDIFEPGADPETWIDHIAAVYRERPNAVLRELLQNAVDSMRDVPTDARFIEVAILSQDLNSRSVDYHLVVRDVGVGMDERTLKRALGILGFSNKGRSDTAIGEFGIGFYSTHAICDDVAVISRSGDSDLTAWHYVPAEKRFHRLQGDQLAKIIRRDYRDHPRPARARAQGTSVYLRLHPEYHRRLRDDWLVGNALARDLGRDGWLLPTRIYVADYSDTADGAKIVDYHNRELTDQSLSIVTPPWSANDGELDDLLPRVFQRLLPYSDPGNYPNDWYSFHTPVKDGFASGFLYLSDPRTKGHVDLYLKSMWVETASDLAPSFTYPIRGLVNVTPGSGFDITVVPARDHVVRTGPYADLAIAVEDACIEFYETRAKILARKLAEIAQSSTSSSGAFRDLNSCMGSSLIYRVLCSLDKVYIDVLQDITGHISRILATPDCQEAIKIAVSQFVSLISPNAAGTPVQRLLQEMQHYADRSYEEDVQNRPTSRKTPRYNPRASTCFLEKVGPYLPFMIYRREQLPGGQVSFQSCRVPLAAIKLFDGQSANTLRVLTKGSPADYLARNSNIPLVLQPQSDADLIILCLVCRSTWPDLTLDFVTFEREIFQDMLTRDEWDFLVNLLKEILVHDQNGDDSISMAAVDARGYSPEYLPIVEHIEHDRSIVIINGYNDLMKRLKDNYRYALERNDNEIEGIVTRMMHELYHHISPAVIATRSQEERHTYVTRTDMMLSFLSMIDKYVDLRKG